MTEVAEPGQHNMWGMACFEGLSAEQQRQVVEEGYLDFGYTPMGECPRPAQIEVTTIWDKFPGPRFYCRGCAIKYLMAVKADPPPPPPDPPFNRAHWSKL